MTLYNDNIAYDADIPYDNANPFNKKDQGSGSGKRNKYQRQVYNQALADLANQSRINAQNISSENALKLVKPQTKKIAQSQQVKIGRPYVRPMPKLGDLSEIREELKKLQLSVAEEISLQQEEDEAICMLLLFS